MNIILANLRTKSPAVHRANDKGRPLCGAKHHLLSVKSDTKTVSQKECVNADQFEFRLSDDRCEAKPKAEVEKVKPLEEYIEDIGDVSCKGCIRKMNK